jgi:hypothetical protein
VQIVLFAVNFRKIAFMHHHTLLSLRRRLFGFSLAGVVLLAALTATAMASCDANGVCTHSRKTIVIVGGGLAGISAAIEVRCQLLQPFPPTLRLASVPPDFPSI